MHGQFDSNHNQCIILLHTHMHRTKLLKTFLLETLNSMLTHYDHTLIIIIVIIIVCDWFLARKKVLLISLSERVRDEGSLCEP